VNLDEPAVMIGHCDEAGGFTDGIKDDACAHGWLGSEFGDPRLSRAVDKWNSMG
jgi:hypothetical protein